MMIRVFLVSIGLVGCGLEDTRTDSRTYYEVPSTTTCEIVVTEKEKESEPTVPAPVEEPLVCPEQPEVKSIADVNLSYTTTVCNQLPVIGVNLFTKDGVKLKDQFVIYSNRLYKIQRNKWTDIWTKIDKNTGKVTEKCKVKLKNNKGEINVKYP